MQASPAQPAQPALPVQYVVFYDNKPYFMGSREGARQAILEGFRQRKCVRVRRHNYT